MNLELHLRMAGVLLLVLAGTHFFLPRELRWGEELGRLSMVNRRVFISHCMFIVLGLVLLGVLSVGYAPLLAVPTPLGRLVVGGLAFCWGVKLVAHVVMFSGKGCRESLFQTVMHGMFCGLWVYFFCVYGAAWWGMRGG